MGIGLVRTAYMVTVTVAAVLFCLLSSARPVAIVFAGAASLLAIGYGVRAFRPARWQAWLLVAVSVVLITIAEAIFTRTALDRAGPVPFPSTADYYVLAAYLPLTLWLLWLGRPRARSHDWFLVIDTTAFTLAGSLLVWTVFGRDAVTNLDVTGVPKVVAIAGSVGFVAVLASSVRWILGWRTNAASTMLAVAVVSFLTADFLNGEATAEGQRAPRYAAGLCALAFAAFCGAAALSRSMGHIAARPNSLTRLGFGRLAVLAVGLLVAPSALLVEATRGPVTEGVAIALVSAAVGLLILIRAAFSVRTYQRRVFEEHALRGALHALVIATTRAEVVAALDGALAALTPVGSPAVRVEQRAPPYPADPVPMGANDPRAPAELTVRCPPASSEVAGDQHTVFVFTARLGALTELAPGLRALGEQAGAALDRIGLMSRVRAEERERYFGTLVRTSSDATLISRVGRIEYASPAAFSMFGRDVRGERFDDLVGRVGDATHGWSESEDGAEGVIRHPGTGTRSVLVVRRDLRRDHSVNGVVTTMRDITAERRLQRDLAYRASHDALTGLVNAQHFRDQLRRGDAGSATGTAALFVDLDDFKAVNDAYGHEIGDEMLVSAAVRIQSFLGGTDLAARLGGDEFAVLLRDLPDEDAARAATEGIAAALARPVVVRGITVDGGASIGLAYRSAGRGQAALLAEADNALYAAKAQGKGHWRQYRPGMSTPTRRRLEIRHRLERAMAANRLRPGYQPIVDLRTGETVGFDASANLGDGGPPMPATDVAAAAQATGGLTGLEDWILHHALADLATLNPPGSARSRYVSVNLAEQMIGQPEFVTTVRGHLDDTGADAHLLVIEISESMLLAEDGPGWSALSALRRQGVRVAVDRYGAGSASLRALSRAGVDLVRFDPAFAADLGSPRGRRVLRAVTVLCRELGLDQVMDGVSDAHRHEALLGLGCRYGQGELFGSPVPIDTAAQRGRGAA